jgi:hypothetical protein
MEPPGGWRFTDVKTGMLIFGANKNDLFQKCKEHRRANGLPIPADFDAHIERHICLNIPPELVLGLSEDRVMSEATLTRFNVMQKTDAFLLAWKQSGQKLVDQDSATLRAGSCLNCSSNSKNVCLTCQGLDVWIGGWTNQRKTPYDKYLFVCACDGIILYAGVHAGFIYDKDVYPEHCWKRECIKSKCVAANTNQIGPTPIPAPQLVAGASSG